MYACDRTWWREYFDETPDDVERWTADVFTAGHYQINHIQTRIVRNHGASPSDKWVSQGKNSGHQAIGLARLWGAKRIILIGFDMQHTGGKAHWHGDHRKGLGNAVGIDQHAKFFDQLAADLQNEGIEVFNCSSETALTCFERAKLGDVL